MFSGIIEQKAKILNREGGLFTIENTFQEPLQIGQSIAHDGACMTLTYFDSEKYTFFAMEESLKITSFGSKKAWDFFNVERCVKVWDRLDGHIVSGHVDTVWEVKNIIQNKDTSIEMIVEFDEKFSKYIIPKGSITINGVSLTIVQEWKNFLSVCLIPITQEITNLGNIKIWDKVNLEFDIVGKYIYKNNHEEK